MMDQENGYTSTILYHFVGRKEPKNHERNFATLRQILTYKCVAYSRHPHGGGETKISIDWNKSLLTQDLIVRTVTCYAEIPYRHLEIHLKKYGHFGLGFEKQLLIEKGARPVIYLPYSPHDRSSRSAHGMDLVEDIEQVFRSFNKVQEKISANNPPPDTRQLKKPAESFEQAISNMYLMFAKDFLAFIKASDCTLGEDHLENYMMEREWRRYQHFWFTPAQVRRIVVAKGFGDRLVREFPEYASKISEWEGSRKASLL